jgi:hypothetical protein
MFDGVAVTLICGGNEYFVTYGILDHFHDGSVCLKWCPNVLQNPEKVY